MNHIFNELDQRLSVVERYNLFSTIQRQNVASHVFNVTRIAIRIAEQWYGLPKEALLPIYEWAHNHENVESLSGDLPAMVKGYFDEERFERDHAHLLPIIMAPNKGSPLYTIVKLADIMDVYMFFCMERALGSQHIARHVTASSKRLLDFAHDNCPEHAGKLLDWMQDISDPKSDTHIQIKWSEER